MAQQIVEQLRKRQIGAVMSLDMLAGLAILLMVTAFALPKLRDYTDTLANKSAADHALIVLKATTDWQRDNQATILATANPLAQYPLSTISSYLPTNFSSTNTFGQTYSIRALKTAAGKLETLVVTTGGQTLDNGNVRRVAALVGGAGGFVDSTNTNQVKGTAGLWGPLNFPLYGTTPGAGHLAMAVFLQNGEQVDQFIYRNAVSGRPELNAINTPLKLNYVVTEGSSDSLCNATDPTTTGRIASDSVGAVLSCWSGAWKRQGGGYWKDPVALFSSLPTTGNNTGDVRLVTQYSPARPFWWNGTTWQAIAVDENGNMSVPGALNVTGNISGQTLRPTLIAAEGDSCAGYSSSAIAGTTTGLILSCQSGGGVWTWKKTGSTGTIDEQTGLPLNTCTTGAQLISFKRIGGTVFARGITPGNGGDSGWQAVPFSYYSGYLQARWVSGNTYGLWSVNLGAWNCWVVVP